MSILPENHIISVAGGAGPLALAPPPPLTPARTPMPTVFRSFIQYQLR